jgi:hypothetical protein
METTRVKSPARRRRWPWLLLLPVAAFAAYIALALWWSYSEGERVGVLQKLSRKGWVCKTYEGELALYVVSGVAPQIWSFTVRDQNVATRLNAALGERVRLHYSEHRGLPSGCFGDTGYFVDSLELSPAQPAMPGAAPARATPVPGAPQATPGAAPAPAPTAPTPTSPAP